MRHRGRGSPEADQHENGEKGMHTVRGSENRDEERKKNARSQVRRGERTSDVISDPLEIKSVQWSEVVCVHGAERTR